MQTEEQEIVRAIIANPDDDTRRLAYADWLDEHARELPVTRQEPARARAELIRLEIEREREIIGAVLDKPLALARSKRIAQLRGLYTDAWLSEQESLALQHGMILHGNRGLFEEVRCTVKAFVEGGAALLELNPITSFRVIRLNSRNVEKLAECQHFSRVRTLKIRIDENLEPIGTLLSTTPLNHLRGLVLDTTNIDMTTEDWYERAEAIIERLTGKNWGLKQLKRLILFGAGVGAVGGKALADSHWPASLDVLDLRHNPGLGGSRVELREKFGKRVWLEQSDLHGLTYGHAYSD